MPEVTDPTILGQLQGAGKPQARQGGVIITDPNVAAEEARAEERLRIEQERAAMEAERLRLAQEAGGREQAEFERKQAGLTTDVGEARKELERVIAAAARAKQLSKDGLFATGAGSSVAGAIPGTTARDVKGLLDTIGANTAFTQLQKMRQASPTGGALGNITERELALLQSTIASLDPGLSDEQFQANMDEIIGAYQSMIDKLDAPEELKTPSVTMGEEIKPSAWDKARQNPPDAPITGEAGPVLTPEDRQLQAEITAAFKAGASLEELQAISAKYGRAFPIDSEEALNRARNEGRSINVIPSGTQDKAEILGVSADSPGGAYAIMAANGLLSGGLDELVGAMGGDAETAEAAKQTLRDRYPKSSFAGEASGQVMQTMLTRRAAMGLGASGNVATAGAELGGGAAYGAGEANDNRGLGAAAGLAGAVAGKKVADWLIDPAVSRVVQKIAKDIGVPVEAVEQAAAEALDSVPLPQAEQTEIARIARAAVGPTGKKAREKLAVMAQVNPEARAAAERLGMDLPLDILSDSTQLKTLTGLSRSQIASEADSAWRNTVSDTINRADDAIRSAGASPDLATVSDDIRARLTKDMGELETQAKALRSDVDAAINVQDRVEATNLQDALGAMIRDMGGLSEAKQAMSGEEKKLLAMLGEGDVARQPTYARLNQIRDQIGEALYKGRGPWVDTAQANLKRYYGALAEDQLAHIERVAGTEIAEKMRGSNSLFSKMYGVRETMQGIYGSQLERDIGPLILRAIKTGSGGNGQELRKLLSSVPQDMQQQAVLTGILADATRRGANGGFSFGRFAETYRGLRQNAPIYKQIAEAVGPQGAQLLNDLYAVSRRMADGEAKIVRTGASVQPLLTALNGESLLASLFNGAVKRVPTVVGGAVGTAAGGPAGAMAGGAIGEGVSHALARGGKSRLEKLHTLLSSEVFRETVEKASTSNDPKLLNRLIGSKEWNNYAARVLGLSTPEQRRQWLESAFTAAPAIGAAGMLREDAPTSTIEVK